MKERERIMRNIEELGEALRANGSVKKWFENSDCNIRKVCSCLFIVF